MTQDEREQKHPHATAPDRTKMAIGIKSATAKTTAT
jgi:hypothetical protein